MRSFSHWTPAYLFSRLVDYVYRFRNPEAPWLTPRAIDYLKHALQSDFVGLEYGSGRSTAWFARHVRQLTSIEHNGEWYERVRSGLAAKSLNNVDYHHFNKPESGLPLEEKMKSEYVMASPALKNNSLDFILVDGVERPACALRSLPLLKNGGILIIDDANHYLPCESWAPNTRSLKAGPIDTEWAKVLDAIKSWDAVWFGNGVKETAVFHKPDTL